MDKNKVILNEEIPTFRDWLILIVLSLIWGSSFILIKKSLIAMSPQQMASMRIAISCLAFIPVVIHHRKIIEWHKLSKFLLIGLLGSGIPAFCYAFAQTQLNSSVTGLLNSLTPLFTFLIGVLFFKSSFKSVKLVGLLMGLIGASILIIKGDNAFQTNLFYASFIVLGTFCYGANVNFVKLYFQNTKPIIVSAVSFLTIGIPALIYLLATGALSEVVMHEGAVVSLTAVVILSLIGTVIATILYFTLVQTTSPVFASSVAYLMPLVALFWGVFDGEPFGIQHVLSFLLILAGIYLIRK